MNKINYNQFKKELERLKKSYFTISELKKIYGNKYSSLKNLLSRWSKENLINPISKGIYCFDIANLDYLNLACTLDKPSYISFEYALNYYGLINQVPEVVTLATTNRHKFVHVGPYIFEYTKLKKSLFFGYYRVDNYYIATPEKALLDTLYLVSRNKRLEDLYKLNTKKLSKRKLKAFLKEFPKYVELELEKFQDLNT